MQLKSDTIKDLKKVLINADLVKFAKSSPEFFVSTARSYSCRLARFLALASHCISKSSQKLNAQSFALSLG